MVNVIPTIISVNEENRKQKEQNYLNRRRLVEDPIRDEMSRLTLENAQYMAPITREAAQLALNEGRREDAAGRALVGKYGDIAGNPYAAAQAQSNSTFEKKQQDALEAAKRASALRVIGSMGSFNSGQEAVTMFDGLSDERLQQLFGSNISKEDIATLFQAANNTGMPWADSVKMLERVYSDEKPKTPEYQDTYVAANGQRYIVFKDGRIELAPGKGVYANPTGTGTRSGSAAKKNKSGTARSVITIVENINRLLDEGARIDALPHKGAGFAKGVMTGLSGIVGQVPAGKAVLNVIAPDQQKVRSELAASTEQLFQLWRQISEIGATMANTEKETQNLRNALNNPQELVETQRNILKNFLNAFMLDISEQTDPEVKKRLEDLLGVTLSGTETGTETGAETGVETGAETGGRQGRSSVAPVSSPKILEILRRTRFGDELDPRAIGATPEQAAKYRFYNNGPSSIRYTEK